MHSTRGFWALRGLVVLAVAVTAVVVGTAAASAATPTHLTGSFTFRDNLCGFSGTTHLQFIDNFGSKADGSSYDSGQVVQTFNADNGRGVVVTFAGHEYNAPPVSNPDGTTTLSFVFSEAQNKIQAVGGAVLQMNAGRVAATAVLAPDGSLVSFSVVVLAGPNPNPGMVDNCSVIAPYLAGA
jgi:hypothetical protein